MTIRDIRLGLPSHNYYLCSPILFYRWVLGEKKFYSTRIFEENQLMPQHFSQELEYHHNIGIIQLFFWVVVALITVQSTWKELFKLSLEFDKMLLCGFKKIFIFTILVKRKTILVPTYLNTKIITSSEVLLFRFIKSTPTLYIFTLYISLGYEFKLSNIK